MIPLRAWMVLWSTVWLVSCATVPLKSVSFPHSTQRPAKCLLVFLPGAGDRAPSFEKEGFVQAVRQSGLSADLIATDLWMPYYLRRRSFDRVRLDVLEPAREKGYQQIWVLGISMGGMGGLLLAQKHPGLVDGLFVVAPYLGDSDLHREIRDAGGVAKWSPPSGDLRNYQRSIWRWLKEVAHGRHKKPSFYLGYGDEDGFSSGHRLLASALPADRVFHTPGGHEWGPWRELLTQFLSSSDFARTCRP